MVNKMKKLTLLLVMFTILLTSCGETTTKAESYSDTHGSFTISNGAFSRVDELGEFDYKGHTYIYTEVRDGIAMSHAGHCKCNTK